jgi:hypothetical protein
MLAGTLDLVEHVLQDLRRDEPAALQVTIAVHQDLTARWQIGRYERPGKTIAFITFLRPWAVVLGASSIIHLKVPRRAPALMRAGSEQIRPSAKGTREKVAAGQC